MRRLLWLGLGAAAGYYAARKIPPAVERTRERGISGNAAMAGRAASRVASSARSALTVPAVPTRPGSDAGTTGDAPTARREARP